MASRPDLADPSQNDLITISVGTTHNQTTFYIKKHLLTTSSLEFTKYFATKDYSGPKQMELNFSEEDPEIWALIVKWLIWGTIPGLIAGPTQASSTAIPNTEITRDQKTQLLKILARTSKQILGLPFRAPVAEIWPEYAPLYQQTISNPIDLATISSKLTNNMYADLDEVKAEFDLLFHNSVRFNGLDNSVTSAASKLREKMQEKIDSLSTSSSNPTSPKPKPKGKDLTSLRHLSTSICGEEGENDRVKRHSLVKLTMLSERYRFDTLSALAISTLLLLYHKHRLVPSAATVAEVYQGTMPRSKMRLWVARALACAIVSKSRSGAECKGDEIDVDGEAKEVGGDADGGGDENGVSSDWIWKVLMEKGNEELGLEVLAELRGCNGKLIREAEEGGCEYHWHGDDEFCPLVGIDLEKWLM